MKSFPTTDGVCRQNTDSHDKFVHVQRITERSAQVQSLITRTRVDHVVCFGVSKVVYHPSVMSRTCHRTLLLDLFHLHHLPSDHLLPHCPVLSRPILDWIAKPCKTHGGITKSASPTQFIQHCHARYTPEYGQASSWYNRGWALSNTRRNIYSGWSKRATRGYQSDYDDRSRQWEDSIQTARQRTLRGSPRSRLWQRLRLSRTATGITDVSLRTTP